MIMEQTHLSTTSDDGLSGRLYQYLGCHAVDADTYCFRVWAPNAAEVSLVGDFNGWDPATSPMTKNEEDGVWSCEYGGIAEFSSYKYCVVGADGVTRMKADPFACHFETRPSNASKVYRLEGYDWQDGEWLRLKEKNAVYHCPINIYELHIASWRQYPDGSVFSYTKLADELIPYIKSIR